jgi:predicted permease
MVSETREGGGRNSVSGGAFLDWRPNRTAFSGLTLTNPVSYNLRGGDSAPERLKGLEVSHEFFDVLGTSPLLGRLFTLGDDDPAGHSSLVVLTEELWRTRFGGDRRLVGGTITLDEVPRTVIGVVPSGAWLVKDQVFFVPAVLQPARRDRGTDSGHWATVIGRLAPGVSVARADAELKAMKAQRNADYPAFKQAWGVEVEAITDILGTYTRAPLLVLLGAVSLVLLIACVNVANLVLARAYHRQQELAVRAALGAGSGRIVRQVLTENLVLALAGGASGVTLAFAGVGLLRATTADLLPFTFAPRVDLRVLGAALLATLATGLLFGVLPALASRRPDLTRTLASGCKGTMGGGRQRAQTLLVVAEVALTVVLLAAAGLLMRSLGKAAAVDPGFEPSRVLAFDVSLPERNYQERARRLVFVNQLLERVRALPGVERAGSGMSIPFSGGAYGEYFRRPDRPETADELIGRLDFVSPGFLEALGARVGSGRLIEEADNTGAGRRVAVVNARTARRLYPDRDPIGQPISITGNDYTIVGVVADIVDRQLDAPTPLFAWVPQMFNAGRISVAVRTRRDPLTLVEPLRAVVQQVDGGVAMANPRALSRELEGSLLLRRVVLAMIGIFAAIALILASVGLYGVMAYGVATRQREYGIRLALGAVRSDVVQLVLGRGARLVLVGLAMGLGAALGMGRLLASELYQVRASDPLAIGGAAATLVVVSLAACAVPAWRAARLAPADVLRSE